MTMEELDVYEVVIDTKPIEKNSSSVLFCLTQDHSRRVTVMVAADGYGQAVKKARQYIEFNNLKDEVLKQDVSPSDQPASVLDVVSIALTQYKFIQ